MSGVTGTITPGYGGAVELALPEYGTAHECLVQITGVYAGVHGLYMQGTMDGKNWANLAAVDLATGMLEHAPLVLDSIVNRMYSVCVAGLRGVRVRVGSLAAGTMVVQLATMNADIVAWGSQAGVARAEFVCMRYPELRPYLDEVVVWETSLARAGRAAMALLVYADWLEEHNCPVYAEWLRGQARRAGLLPLA